MSICYSIFLEAKINGVWTDLNYYMPNEKGEKIINPIVEDNSGLRNFFGWNGDYRGTPLRFPDLSSGLQEALGWHKDDGTHYEAAYINENIDLFIFESTSRLAQMDLESPEFYGYVGRQHKRQFERGESEGISEYLSVDEFRQLTRKEQQGYCYFEWTEPYGTLHYLRIIKRRMLDRMESYNALFLRYDASLTTDMLRIVVRVS